MAGTSTLPSAAASPAPDPVTPDRTHSVATVTCPRPPRRRPISVTVKFTRRSVIFALSISSPNSRKSGTDRMRNESRP